MTAILGTTMELTGTFRERRSGQLIDPATVLLKLKRRDSTDPVVTLTYGVSATLVRKSQGVYEATYKPAVAGVWLFRFEGVGPADVVTEGSFTIRPPSFT